MDILLKEKLKSYAGWLLAIILIIMAAWYISEFHYQLMLIQGDSMSPSFHHLQLVVLDKHSEEFSYGDVVAFRCAGLDAVLVKRVVACPGDTVQIVFLNEMSSNGQDTSELGALNVKKGGILLVNGEINTVYGREAVFDYAGIAEKELKLGKGEYFVIGDNVAESKDSRYQSIGTVRVEDIIGKVLE